MFGHQKYAGLWWRSEDRFGSRLGTLSVDQGQPILEVDEDFGRDSNRGRGSFDSSEVKPRIVGGNEGHPVTLEDLRLIPGGTRSMGARSARYRAQVALVGKRFAEDEEATFDEVAMRISDLSAWTEISGFKTFLETEPLEGVDRVVASEVRYEAPEDVRIQLARGEEITISFTCLGRGLGGGSDRVEMRQEVVLGWRFARPLGAREIFERVGQIRNFLRLAVGRPVSVISVAGFQDSHTHRGTNVRRPIEMYWHIPHNPEPEEDPRHPLKMLFTLSDLGSDPASRFRRWLQMQARFEPVFDLYFGALYDPDPYLEVKFLAFAQALETYDLRRRRRGGRLSLATRIRDVLAQCKKVSARIVGEDFDTFVINLRDARNYYTHRDPDLARKAAREGRLFLLSIQLETILEMSLLRQLGFSCGEIEAILDRALRFSRIDLLREQLTEEMVAEP